MGKGKGVVQFFISRILIGKNLIELTTLNKKKIIFLTSILKKKAIYPLGVNFYNVYK